MDKDALLSVINYREFYGRYFTLPAKNKAEVMVSCPWHEDKVPSFSLNVETGLWICFSCGEAGDVFTFYGKQNNLDFVASLTRLAEEYKTAEPIPKRKTANLVVHVKPIPEAIVQKWQAHLTPEALDYLHTKRGLTDATIAQYGIGYIPGRGRYTLPVRDAAGVCVNIRLYKPDAGTRKMLPYFDKGYGVTRLYPDPNIPEADVILCEGEWDCLLARQNGLDCWTHTCGAKSFPEEFGPLFAGRNVTILYDVDKDGVEGAKRTAGILLPHAAEVKIASLPLTEPDNADITDWFVLHSKTLKEFRAVLDTAQPYKNGSTPPAELMPAVWFEDLGHHHTEWIVHGLIAKGGITVLAGEPGAGKTTLAAELVYHIAHGEEHWGEEVTVGKTLWLGYDDPVERIRDEKIELLGDIPPRCLCSIPDPPHLSEITLPVYVEFVQTNSIDLIVADTVLDWLALPDYDKTAPVRAAMDLLRRLSEASGAAILGICHVSKDPNKIGVSRISNSTQISGKCDIACILFADHADPDSCRLTIAKNRLGPSGWNTKLTKTDGRFLIPEKQPERPRTTIEKVFNVIAGVEFITRPDLNKRFEGIVSSRAVDRATKYLEETGRITKTWPGSNEGNQFIHTVAYCIPSRARAREDIQYVESVESVESVFVPEKNALVYRRKKCQP